MRESGCAFKCALRFFHILEAKPSKNEKMKNKLQKGLPKTDKSVYNSWARLLRALWRNLFWHRKKKEILCGKEDFVETLEDLESN